MPDPVPGYLTDTDVPEAITLSISDRFPVAQQDAPQILKWASPNRIREFLLSFFQTRNSRLDSISEIEAPEGQRVIALNQNGAIALAEKADLVNGQIPASQARASTIDSSILDALFVFTDAKGTATNVPRITNEKIDVAANIAWSKIDKTDSSPADVGAISINDVRLTDERVPTDGSVSNAKVASDAAISWSKIDKTGATPADVGAIAPSDARLTDTRIPTDGSVSNAKVASDAAISWSKISKAGATPADIGAAAVNHNQAWTTIEGVPAALTQISALPAINRYVIIGNGTQFQARELAIADVPNLQDALDQKVPVAGLTATIRGAVTNGAGLLYNPSLGVFSLDVNFINQLIESYVPPAPTTYALDIESGFALSIENGMTLSIG